MEHRTPRMATSEREGVEWPGGRWTVRSARSVQEITKQRDSDKQPGRLRVARKTATTGKGRRAPISQEVDEMPPGRRLAKGKRSSERKPIGKENAGSQESAEE